jgi:transposase-like protein
MLKMSASGSAVVLEDRQRGATSWRRRRFTAEYKLRVLREADACTEPGEIVVLLRREGWYTSHLCLWRKQGRARELTGLAPARRGPAPKATHPLEAGVGVGAGDAVAERPC